MNYLVLDVETTTSNKGNPFDETNSLCYIGLGTTCYPIAYDDSPYRMHLDTVQSRIDKCELLVGFNIKFDLHWIRRYGIQFSNKRVWDCQLVHFILTGQENTYPSLDSVAEHYGLPSKLDVVATEYWANKIDTPDIPKDILEDYLRQDLVVTEQVYLKQLEEVKKLSPQLQRLISLHNQDLLVLEEMESNGLLYNEALSEELANGLEETIADLDRVLYEYTKCEHFNYNSVDHLSALLYGGTITYSLKQPNGFYKTGLKAGQVKESWFEYKVEFPRLVNPLKGTELAKEGLYSTDEATLKSLKHRTKASRELVEVLLRRSELEKRLTTYYRGLPETARKYNWKKGMIYGQLNQCVARTGRLSSSRPNLQNFDGEIKQLFYSRYN